MIEFVLENGALIGLIVFGIQMLWNEYRNHHRHITHRDAINDIFEIMRETDGHEFDRLLYQSRTNYRNRLSLMVDYNAPNGGNDDGDRS